ncbi:MAG: bifunctional DNA primase/polymerase [Gemmatales bacterium]|nr:bifunctional DNA primase/polymerase [Gemmatales bacterium]MDW7995341.1 bifunctional DNA primase/polymerase [Gemmatales bacterium]
MANDLVSAALRYAELGYPVFPCAPAGERPLVARGFHEATNDLEQIERWWKEHPQANIGLPTAGLVVLDLDRRNNPWPTDTDQAADLASAGAIAVTPHGGRHILFRRPEGKAWKCSTGKLAPGVWR